MAPVGGAGAGEAEGEVVAAAASASRFVWATMAAFSARVALLDGAEGHNWLRSWAADRPWLFKTVTMPPC